MGVQSQSYLFVVRVMSHFSFFFVLGIWAGPGSWKLRQKIWCQKLVERRWKLSEPILFQDWMANIGCGGAPLVDNKNSYNILCQQE